MDKTYSCNASYYEVSCCNLVVAFQRAFSRIFMTCTRKVNCLEACGTGVVLVGIYCLAGASFYSVFCPLWWEYRLLRINTFI
jgi:hypothetical protein